jgi:hypothetical protein
MQLLSLLSSVLLRQINCLIITMKLLLKTKIARSFEFAFFRATPLGSAPNRLTPILHAAAATRRRHLFGLSLAEPQQVRCGWANA